jgi:hypothetical protein
MLALRCHCASFISSSCWLYTLIKRLYSVVKRLCSVVKRLYGVVKRLYAIVSLALQLCRASLTIHSEGA